MDAWTGRPRWAHPTQHNTPKDALVGTTLEAMGLCIWICTEQDPLTPPLPHTLQNAHRAAHHAHPHLAHTSLPFSPLRWCYVPSAHW